MKIRAFAPRAACLLLAGVLAACGNGLEPQPEPEPDVALPPSLTVCETNTQRICGDWALTSDSTYEVAWSQGSEAVITVKLFRGGRARFERLDKPNTTTAGMRAEYIGTVVGSSAMRGWVDWHHEGVSVTGTWTATW